MIAARPHDYGKCERFLRQPDSRNRCRLHARLSCTTTRSTGETGHCGKERKPCGYVRTILKYCSANQKHVAEQCVQCVRCGFLDSMFKHKACMLLSSVQCVRYGCLTAMLKHTTGEWITKILRNYNASGFGVKDRWLMITDLVLGGCGLSVVRASGDSASAFLAGNCNPTMIVG